MLQDRIVFLKPKGTVEIPMNPFLFMDYFFGLKYFGYRLFFDFQEFLKLEIFLFCFRKLVVDFSKRKPGQQQERGFFKIIFPGH